MSNHTPEPWNGKRIGISVHYFESIDAEITFTGKSDEAMANARRIVACVNACRGLSTDELEQHGLVSAVGTELAELEQQRDELLASLQRLISSDPHIEMFPTSELEICANNEALPPTLREQAASVIQARAVIAMVKGGAS